MKKTIRCFIIITGFLFISKLSNAQGYTAAAGLKFGVAYFFSCHIGLGASFTGQYFNNKSDLTNYSLYALPVQGGIHFRF